MRTFTRLSLLACVALPLSAQAPTRGAFVTTLGRDTIAVEDFTWTGNTLTGNAVLLTPRVMHTRFEIAFDARNQPTSALITRKVANDTLPPIEIQFTIGADSVRWTRRQGVNRRDTTVVKSGPIYFEELNLWSIYEFQTRALAGVKADSTKLWTMNFGSPRQSQVTWRRRGADTLTTMFFYPEYWNSFIYDRSGKLLSVDGTHTTIKTMARRLPQFGWESFLATAKEREKSGGNTVANLSPADSVSTKIGSAAISIAYSAPGKRGRVIWGQVVPFNEVWRAGANAATRLHLSEPLMIGGTLVPAGSYTVFALVESTKATLILNKQVGQWGTEYHEDRDQARIPVTSLSVAFHQTPVEQMRFSFTGAGATGRALVLDWDKARWSISIGLP